jgi:hypothetical protein
MLDSGLALAAGRLRPGGLLVSNAIDEAASVAREIRRLFASTLQIEIEDYDNRVVVGAGFPLSGRALRAALIHHPTLAATAPRFKIRKSRGHRRVNPSDSLAASRLLDSPAETRS